MEPASTLESEGDHEFVSGGADADAVDAGGGASRPIAEADILQLSGDRLYALARFRDVSIVDVSNSAQLRPPQEQEASEEWFEMYADDGLVYSRFNGWNSYVYDDGTGARTWFAEKRQWQARGPVNIQIHISVHQSIEVADCENRNTGQHQSKRHRDRAVDWLTTASQSS